MEFEFDINNGKLIDVLSQPSSDRPSSPSEHQAFGQVALRSEGMIRVWGGLIWNFKPSYTKGAFSCPLFLLLAFITE